MGSAVITPGFGTYLAGTLSLVAMAISLGLGAYWLRRWIVPQFAGALARLAEIVMAIALLVITLEILGSLSLLREGYVVGAVIVVGLAAALLARAKAPRDGVEPVQPPQVDRLALIIALAV